MQATERESGKVSRLGHALAAALLGAGLGVQLFVAVLLAPTAFSTIERPVAGKLMQAVFPGYYGFGLATTGLALLLIVWLAVQAGFAPLRWACALVVAGAFAATVYAGWVLRPEVSAARVRGASAPAGDPAPLEFGRLHRRAETVNIAVFGIGVLGLLLHAAARPR